MGRAVTAPVVLVVWVIPHMAEAAVVAELVEALQTSQWLVRGVFLAVVVERILVLAVARAGAPQFA